MLFIPETNFKIGRAVFSAWLLTVLVLVPILFLVPAADARDVLFKGVINAHKLNIRSRPARGAEVVIVLDKGERVDVLGDQGGIGGWLMIKYKDQQGYLRNRPKYITLTRPESQPAAPRILKPQVVKPKAPAKGAALKDGPGITAPKPKAARAKQKVIAEKIQEETRKMASFSQKEMEILDALNEIDLALNRARLRAGDLRRETHALSTEIERIQGRLFQLTASMEKTQAYAGLRLNSLYRMHMMGRLEMAGPPSSLFDFFVTQKALKAVVASDFTLLENQARSLDELGRLDQELKGQIQAKTNLEEELAFQIRVRENESRKKAAILEDIQHKKKYSQAALASLKVSARALETALTAMGLKGSPVLDDTSFVKQKGRLGRPVQGKIISRYGKARKGDYKAFTFQSGVDIRVERGEPVRSVFKGEIMFAQWLKGYGNLVIINHGDNYYTLYAHVEEVFKKKGERVGTGEVIATAGDTGSIKGLCLHFEVRHHGKPVNPMKWLRKGA